jgi:hypothetical protein
VSFAAITLCVVLNECLLLLFILLSNLSGNFWIRPRIDVYVSPSFVQEVADMVEKGIDIGPDWRGAEGAASQSEARRELSAGSAYWRGAMCFHPEGET